ncbi:MAG: SAM-dependent methyltransferase [Pseudomonadota bacterium]|nr:SAM-dependent methyltransferase [Pseudomonadota bacterium]
MGPLLTAAVLEELSLARRSGIASLKCSLDLQLSSTIVAIGKNTWSCEGREFPYPMTLKPRTIYHWVDCNFEPVARFGTSLIKLVPTEFGPPTFEIDGIKMLPTALGSPLADAARKVGLIRPRGKVILDTCGGLGYFAACCVRGRAVQVLSFEINPDVIWLRGINPWSPANDPILQLAQADVAGAITTLPAQSIDAALHDPPRFGIAGELYSQHFYHQLSRVLKRRGRLFHYTGAPNKHSSGRDLASEVSSRLRIAGFDVEKSGDGVLAVKS